VRLWVVGLGTVGRWLLRALDLQREQLERRYGFAPVVVGVANARLSDLIALAGRTA
jgi:homoserine dehydrogenase